MAVGRYPLRSAWGMRRAPTRDANSVISALPRTGGLPLDRQRRGETTTVWVNWFLGADGITAATTYEKGYGILKRWDGNMWVPSPDPVFNF